MYSKVITSNQLLNAGSKMQNHVYQPRGRTAKEEMLLSALELLLHLHPEDIKTNVSQRAHNSVDSRLATQIYVKSCTPSNECTFQVSLQSVKKWKQLAHQTF